jgi:hypothetical protein
MDPIADLELGLAEDLAVWLGGEQFGDALDLVLNDGHQTPLDPVGFVALLGREIECETGHGEPSVKERFRNRGNASTSPVLRNFPPTFETPTQRPKHRPFLLDLGGAVGSPVAVGFE